MLRRFLTSTSITLSNKICYPSLTQLTSKGFACDKYNSFRLPYIQQLNFRYKLLTIMSSYIVDTIGIGADTKSENHNSKGDKFDKSINSDSNLREAYANGRKDLKNQWLTYDKSCHIYLYRGGGEPSDNIAAFDLDHTIIKPKSNKRIPKSATDWQFFSVWTKVKLQEVLRLNKSRFIIFTNQNGVGLKLVSLDEIKERIELVTTRLNIPCTVFVATEKDEFRKPNTAMFHLFTKIFNDSMELDLEKSFYCGDAIGYPSHSDADIKFAQALNLPFLTPEKFLRGVKPKMVAVPEKKVKTDGIA